MTSHSIVLHHYMLFFVFLAVNSIACMSGDSINEVDNLNKYGISWRTSANSDSLCLNYIFTIESNKFNTVDGPMRAVASIEIANKKDSLMIYNSKIEFTKFYSEIIRNVNRSKTYDTISLATSAQVANACIPNIKDYTTSLTIEFHPAQIITCNRNKCNSGTSYSLCPISVVIEHIESKKEMFGESVPYRFWEEQILYNSLMNDLNKCKSERKTNCNDAENELNKITNTFKKDYADPILEKFNNN